MLLDFFHSDKGSVCLRNEAKSMKEFTQHIIANLKSIKFRMPAHSELLISIFGCDLVESQQLYLDLPQAANQQSVLFALTHPQFVCAQIQ